MKAKSGLFYSVCLLLNMAATAASQQDTSDEIAILFYNVENLFDADDDPVNFGDDEFTENGAFHYTDKIYRQKLKNLAEVIRQAGTARSRNGAVIAGFAEVENKKVLMDLAKEPALRERRYEVVHFEGRDSRGIDVGLFYQSSFFRVETARSVPVNLADYGEEGRTRDLLYVRGLLKGERIHLFVMHWPSRRGGEAGSARRRKIAAGICRRMTDSILATEPAARVILMGDLNDDPVDASVVKILRAKGSARTKEAGALYNPWVRFYREGKGTLGFGDSWSLFDQIIVSKALMNGGSGWHYRGAGVFNPEFLKYKSGRYRGYPLRSFEGNRWNEGYSDHFPVFIYLGTGISMIKK